MTDNIPEIFGTMVFNDAAMQQWLPRDIYKAVKKTMQRGSQLPLDVANVVAAAMRQWAVGLGATHFTHWFQPMTGIAAEKHDSFIRPDDNGRVIMEFSGSELVRGESDASSFPSGGLRATFEARGYTIWDTTSYAFIKDGTLCIPTAFCSYDGEALDMKTPLLRSMEALDAQAMRILRLFGNERVRRVVPTVGSEQEFFLVDRDMYLQRPDMVYTGRTLFGRRPPKGQELDDHYCVALAPRVSVFMHELEQELWKLGVYAATKHNETAPGQHEMALIHTTANIACDHNQLTMEMMKSVATRHNLVCLLHEKPFMGVNGSGKHNNWSLASDKGANLLEPGETPYENAQFLLFLVAVIAAVDEYQELLRASAASAGNDHRLGADEAPPAIVSMFVGDELFEILTAIEAGAAYHGKDRGRIEIGVTALPQFPKDSTDRNRTSPMAFTGNKFEFRMLGSQFSLANPNIVLNTAVAEVLSRFADELETAADFKIALAALIKETVHKHKRIIFNGNNYGEQWPDEAAARGLSNVPNAAEALAALVSEKSRALFGKHHVFGAAELASRYEIRLEGYCKTLHIEAAAMSELVRGEIVPACLDYQSELAGLIAKKQALGIPSLDCGLETGLLTEISAGCAKLHDALVVLENFLYGVHGHDCAQERAKYCGEKIAPAMGDLRNAVDALEALAAKKHWPLPSYAQLLYSVE
ncbi:MAG: glutamine synthetase III [Clostridiales bacterium]|jgi:glutamine synthetase|nr:glutamine synthetase III [Clostridiales bacterium]